MKPAPDHLTAWKALARPPKRALKQIKGGRLQGMTDVNPQWRYEAMTAQFGPCGIGWKFEIDKFWNEQGVEGEVLVFVQVSVRVRLPEGAWSEAIIGVGGNHLIVKEAKGLRANDEGYKMAVTDALSAALKMLGVAADVYAGLWDGSKYVTERQDEAATVKPDKETKAARKSQGKLPEGIVYIEKVVPRSKGNIEWSEVITSDGEELIAFQPGCITLAVNLAQEAAPVEISKHRNAKGRWEIDELARWKPETAAPPMPEQLKPGDAFTADDVGF